MKVFEGKMITVEVEDGKEIVRHGAAVAVVPVDREGRVVLVRQDRPAVGGKVLEIPAGMLDDGEEPLDAAKRELREETGLHGGEWSEVATVLSSPGFTDERIHLFVATRLEEGDDDPDDGEDVELVRVPRKEIQAMLPEVEDAKTLAGLQALLRARPKPAEDPGKVASLLLGLFLGAILLVAVLLVIVFDTVVILPIQVVRALAGRQSWSAVKRYPGFVLTAPFFTVAGVYKGVRNSIDG